MLSFKTRRTVPFLAVSLCALSLAACGGSGDKGQPLDLTILHINDHHSHLDAESTALTLKDAAGASKSVTVELGGFARVSAAIEALAAGKPNVLKLHAGDALTGTLYFNGGSTPIKRYLFGYPQKLDFLYGEFLLSSNSSGVSVRGRVPRLTWCADTEMVRSPMASWSLPASAMVRRSLVRMRATSSRWLKGLVT